MFQEKRPTCVTVIGWAWIIIGALMIFSAGMGLLALSIAPDQPKAYEAAPLMFSIFPFLALAQIGFAALGVISGIQFLRLKAWSRSVLEGLTWLLLVFIAGFTVYWVIGWAEMTYDKSAIGFSLIGAVMAVAVSAIYAVPLYIMLKYLRGPRVRNAIEGSA